MAKKKSTLLLNGTAIAFLSAICPVLLLAQEAAPKPQELEDIIVTAEKLAIGRSVQKVPIAVTALDADTLAETHMTNIADIGHMAPGVTLESTGTLPGTAAFQIRGVQTRSSTATIDAAVAVLQDGMPLTLQTGLGFLGTFDTQSVEVLRGPQGVLQGVSAAGGAVLFTTPLPTAAFHAAGDFTVGNYNLVSADATVQGALADKLLGKLAISETHSDGYYFNNNNGAFKTGLGNPTGVPPSHATDAIGGVQTVIVKPTFLVELSDDIKWKIYAQLENDVDGGSSPISINPNPFPGPQSKFISTFGYTPQINSYETNLGTPGFTHITEEHLINQLDWSLGDGVWTTIAALRNVNFNSVFNNAGSPFNIVLVDTVEQNRQGSLESRYSGNVGSDLSYVAGVYLFKDNLPARVINQTSLAELGKPLVVPGNPNSPLNMQNQFNDYNQRTSIVAGFANADYTVLKDLTLSAGLRYQYEYKDLYIQPGTNAAGVVYCTTGTLNNCPNTYYDVNKTWYTFTPRTVLSYQVTPDLLSYFSYSKGWGPGNYNAGASSLPAVLIPANSQTVSAYELGVKSQWFDRRLRANLALYDEAFDQIQRTAVLAINGAHISSLLNAANATIRGAELELTALPAEGLRLNASAGYVFAAYDAFTAPLPTNNYTPGLVGTQLAFQTVPKWTTDLGASYNFDLPNFNGAFDVAADYNWRSQQAGDFFNSPQTAIKSYGLLNASMSYEDGPWKLSLWGRNLQNTFYAETIAVTAGWVIFPGMPRTFGATLSARY